MSYDDSRKAEIQLSLSEFEMPPMQDVLLVGNEAPIGPEAARRMVDALSPDQYEIIRVKHDIIEAIVIRKVLLQMVNKEKLIEFILEEGGKIALPTTVIKAQVRIQVHVQRTVDL